MIHDHSRARDIFTGYCGSRFHMDHDGVGDEYRSFAVSPDQEQTWALELWSSLLNSLSPDDTSGLYKLEILNSNYQNGDALAQLIAYSNIHLQNSLPHVKLRYAETIIQLMGGLGRELMGMDMIAEGRAAVHALVGKIHAQLKAGMTNADPDTVKTDDDSKVLDRAEQTLKLMDAWF